jgi:hypothetical protein
MLGAAAAALFLGNWKKLLALVGNLASGPRHFFEKAPAAGLALMLIVISLLFMVLNLASNGWISHQLGRAH